MPRKFVDMARTPEEKAQAVSQYLTCSPMDQPDYPSGLAVSLNEVDLEKLEMSEDVEVGDLIDIRMLGEVTCVNKTVVNGKTCIRVEIQGQKLAIEDENTEPDMGDPRPQKKLKDPRPASERRYAGMAD